MPVLIDQSLWSLRSHCITIGIPKCHCFHLEYFVYRLFQITPYSIQNKHNFSALPSLSGESDCGFEKSSCETSQTTKLLIYLKSIQSFNCRSFGQLWTASNFRLVCAASSGTLIQTKLFSNRNVNLLCTGLHIDEEKSNLLCWLGYSITLCWYSSEADISVKRTTANIFFNHTNKQWLFWNSLEDVSLLFLLVKWDHCIAERKWDDTMFAQTTHFYSFPVWDYIFITPCHLEQEGYCWG